MEVKVPEVLIVIDNVLMKINSFAKGMFAFFGVHFVFNLEYPKKLRHCFVFLDEYLLGIQQNKRIMDYKKGVKKLLA